MPKRVEKWVEALPVELIEEELEELREQARAIQRQIRAREQALEMKRSFDEENAGRSDTPVEVVDTGLRTRMLTPPPFRGREAVRKVIEQTPDRSKWTIPEMLAAIQKRGWIANTHAVQVNLSRMFRDGELEKDGVGVYVVPGRNELNAADQEAQE